MATDPSLQSVIQFTNILSPIGVRVTKMTGSRSDDWIYWHIGYKFS
jgi:hypothetical protein